MTGRVYTGYVPGAFNTSFRYQLADKTGKNVARAGLADLDICLPYTLAFVREIESVEYPNRLLSLQEPEDAEVDGEVQILTVTAADPDGFADPEISSIAVLSSEPDHHRHAGQADSKRRADPSAGAECPAACSAIFRCWEQKLSRSR